MFPENAYSNRSMDGRPLKILMEKNNCMCQHLCSDTPRWAGGLGQGVGCADAVQQECGGEEDGVRGVQGLLVMGVDSRKRVGVGRSAVAMLSCNQLGRRDTTFSGYC